jgi:FlaA1/EpsC-like NDP-sugar epimerase
MQEEEKLYEKLLLKIEDRSSQDYKRIYRKLYYLRNKNEIKQYQKDYYKKRKDTVSEYAPPLTPNNTESFKIIRRTVTIVFE